MKRARILIVMAVMAASMSLLALVIAAQELLPEAVESPGGADYPPISLNISQPSYPVLDPALAADSDSGRIVEQLFAGLVDVDDETGLVEPELATSWQLSADRTVYTFTLRADATWSDGNPVTAHDARYGILRSLDPDTGAFMDYTLYVIRNAQDYNEGIITDTNLVGVYALDATSLRIELEEPASHLLAILAGWVAFPQPQSVIEAHGTPTWTLPSNMVTSGAYGFAESLPDDVLVLRKSETYFDADGAQIEQINLWIRNHNYAWQMYLDGELDMAVVPDGAEVDPGMAAEIDWRPTGRTEYFGFSVSQAPFDDGYVRKAFGSAVNRPGLVAALGGTGRQEGLTFITPDVFGHVDGYGTGVGLPYNPTQAQTWLSMGGYPDCAGMPPITLWSRDRAVDRAVAEHIRDSWGATLGCWVDLQYLSFGELLGFTSSGDAQVWAMGWTADYLDGHNFLGDAVDYNDGRLGGWSSPTYDLSVDMAAWEVDPAVRASYFEQAEESLVETDAVMIPLYYQGERVATKPHLDRTLPPYQPDMASWRVMTDTATVGTGGGILSTGDSSFVLALPPGAVSETVDLTLFPVSWTPPAHALVRVGQAYGLHAVTTGGAPAGLVPGENALLTVKYSDADVAGAAEETVALYSWDGGQWVREPNSTVDMGNNKVTATPNHFSLFALMAGPDSLPTRMDLSFPGRPNPPDPSLAYDTLGRELVEQLFVGLVDVDDETGEVLPELATGWAISADATVFTFTLRGDATWSDGAQITADDAEYGILRTLDPETDSDWAYILYPILNAQLYNAGDITDTLQVGVTALTTTTLRITLEEPGAHLPAILSQPAARPLPEWAIDAYGEAWTEPGNLVSSGPYLLAEWWDEDRLTLEKNPLYYGAADVRIEQVVIWIVPDPAEAWAMYGDDLLDTSPIPYGTVLDPEVVEEAVFKPSQCTYYYGYTNNKYPFSDPRVRQAFTQAIDRQELISDVLDSRAQPATTFATPGTFGAVTPGTAGLSYDPPAAQAALQAFMTAEGMSLTDFNNLTITLMHNTSEGHASIAGAIGDMWYDNLGVSVTITHTEWYTFFNLLDHDTPVAQMPHIWRMGWCADYPDENNWLPPTFHADEGSNRVRRACNDEHCTTVTPTLFDAKLEQARAELDLVARETLYREAEQILAEEEVAYAPIYHYGDLIAVRPYLSRTAGSNLSDYGDWETTKARGGVGSAGGELVSQEGGVTITIPAGALSDTIILNHAPATGMPPGSNRVMIGEVFSLDASYGTDGSPVTLTMPYTLVVSYDEGALGELDEAELGLYTWDGGRWSLEASSVVDASGNTVTATPGHFSRWSVMVGIESHVYLPLTLRNYRTWDANLEENDSLEAAYGPLAADQVYEAFPDDRYDYHFFELEQGEIVTVLVWDYAPTSDFGDMLLLDENGTMIEQFGTKGQDYLSIGPRALGDGKYYVLVYTADNHSQTEPYSLRMTY